MEPFAFIDAVSSAVLRCAAKGRLHMKRNLVAVVFACAILFPLSAMAQEHYTEGSVSRVLRGP